MVNTPSRLPTLRDAAAIVGAAAVFSGIAMIYVPAALIVGGGLLLWGAIWGHIYDSGSTARPS